MRKIRWVSIRRLKIHEYYSTSRIVFKGVDSWPRRYEAFADLESRAIKQFVKVVSQILLAYLIVTTLRNGNNIILKMDFFEASVPAAFFFATCSLLFLFATMIFCQLSAAMSLKIREGAKIVVPGFSSSMYGMMIGKSDDLALGVPVVNNYFLKFVFPLGTIFGYVMLLGLAVSLLPLIAFGGFIAFEQYNFFLDFRLPVLERTAAGAGATIVAASFSYLCMYHLPLPTRKNLHLLRWGFLAKITSGRHPRSDAWLNV